MRKSLILLAFVSTALAGCMQNDAQRALVGAATGAVVADATGGNALTGALVGGAVGATCDEITNICQ